MPDTLTVGYCLPGSQSDRKSDLSQLFALSEGNIHQKLQEQIVGEPPETETTKEINLVTFKSSLSMYLLYPNAHRYNEKSHFTSLDIHFEPQYAKST